MQEYKKIIITKDEIVPVAEKMRKEGVTLAMIHGFLNADGEPDVSYEYQKGETIESYTVVGENVLPSIAGIYDKGAEWPEREINELIGVTFEGLDISKRLFLPESMLEGQGHIFVTPMEDLIKSTHHKDEEEEEEA